MTHAPAAKRESGLVSRRFLLFLLTGGFAAAVNWGSRMLYNLWMPYSAAIVAAYITGMLTAFALAKWFVFTQSRHSTARSVFYFTLVNLVAVIQTWAVSIGLAYWVFPWIGMHWHDRAIAHLAGVAVPVFTSYIGHKRWSFSH
ncbi:MAG: GtrA family protein [Burkholderiaceae bacterium]|jgi:putative flippase GtrA|nr:GtrA family protein [Burkholderiaceae bacterium]